MTTFESPIPLADIESVLAWVDTFKLSRPTKKINRDFSDAVLLAEILNVHYPKLVEMHNYPPRNSHSLKLNNWLTLNRKVLKKLKLNLCINTMEQLANCNNGVIERVLVMVREKIRRDEEMNRSMKDAEQNMSSGGSFYEACGDDENVLVVPVKTRVNGILETVQQKVVNYESFSALKEELKDARDATELLKQKVEHLDNLLKLKDERIDELQKQLERKQSRRKEAEAFQNSLQIPFETVSSPHVPNINENAPVINLVMKTASAKSLEAKPSKEESKIPVKSDSTIKFQAPSKPSLTEVTSKDIVEPETVIKSNFSISNSSYTKFSNKDLDNVDANRITTTNNTPSTVTTDKEPKEDNECDVDRIKSDVFKEIEIIDERVIEIEEFKDSVQDDVTTLTTIEESIHNEIKTIVNPLGFMLQDYGTYGS